ncbi:YG31B [Elysia marginata]|uniref:YG31B n=1 Tax=Elysia marginata TaxID=1093978 RepID=A0AAV4GUN6_9GAST|nr:YG31B [Elysia marginata]
MKAPAGRDKPAPFQRMPLMEEPFQRVVIDLVGPLPVTKEKYEYILTMVDVSTRWAEATPLRQTTADKVAEALFDIFTRVGFPKEIQPDRGQQFMSKLLQEFNSLSNIKHIFSTPYHPQTNGVVERFHSTVKPYQLPFASQKFVKEEIKRLLELGVIEPSVSPFSSPIVLVKKKDGSLRFCIDFRKLNAITVLDATNIPLPEDLFAQLSDSTIFTSCDLPKAYWQISMHPDSRYFTAFPTPLGLMMWTRMLLGLVNAPATFCRLMRLVFNDEPMLLTYFDDTLLHTRSWEDHVLGLRLLLTTLRNHGLTVNPGKLVIGQSSI